MLRAGIAAMCVFLAAGAVFELHCSTVRGGFQPSGVTTNSTPEAAEQWMAEMERTHGRYVADVFA